MLVRYKIDEEKQRRYTITYRKNKFDEQKVKQFEIGKKYYINANCTVKQTQLLVVVLQ